MNLSEILRRHAERRPDRVALVAGGDRLTYAELDREVVRTAALLTGLGIAPGDRVAVLLPNGLAFVDVYAAAMRIGAIFVPLNVRLAVDELAHQLADCKAGVLFAAGHLRDTAERAARSAGARVVAIPSDTGWKAGLPAGQAPPATDVAATPDGVQRIVYTSGTTARPKGTMISHGQVWWGSLTRCAEFEFTSADVTLTVAPLYHVGGLDSFTTPMLLVGGMSVLLPAFDPAAVLDAITGHGVTNTWLAPTLLRQVFDAAEAGHPFDATTLRVVLGGGEKAPAPVIRRLHRLWPGAGYYDAYGLTECQGVATYLHASQALDRLGSVGRPALAREVEIQDDVGRALPPGSPGEICIRGPLVTPGYWQDPDATERALRDGWLHTGDIGYLDEDGYLWIVDRLKDMIRTGLENVAPAEVERVLYEHPAVAETAVVGRPDDRWGEVPVAFVVPTAAAGEPSAGELIDHCRARLAKFKVPRTVTFVGSLPRTASGKIQKHRLREQLAARRGGGGAAHSSSEPPSRR